jgi:hypothetical protein
LNHQQITQVAICDSNTDGIPNLLFELKRFDRAGHGASQVTGPRKNDAQVGDQESFCHSVPQETAQGRSVLQAGLGYREIALLHGGQPSESDYWQGSGGLRRNGQPYGECGFYSTEFMVGFALYTDNAELVLEEWVLPSAED